MQSIVRLCVGIAFTGLFAFPAHADEGLYLRLAGGASHIDEDVFSDVDFDLGYMGSAAIGYNWFFPESIADLRIELEGSYRYNETDTLNNGLGGVPLDGEAEAFTAMVNGYFDFRTTWPVVPYLGAGIGASRVSYQDDGGGGAIDPIDATDTKFAYQVMGGFNYDLGSNLALGVEYRYLEVERLDMRDVMGIAINPEYQQHAVLLTMTLGF